MTPRMTNPTIVVPGALQPLLDLRSAIMATGVPKDTLVLLHLRISQLNGRAIMIPVIGDKVTDEDRRHAQVQHWRESSVFSPAECAALALGEAATYLDREEPVSNSVWDEARKHYSDEQLGALVLQIGLINLWNRINIVTKQEALDWSVPDEEWVPMSTRLRTA